MARRVFLHIGTMKSATSYVQDLCDHNRAALAAQGVLWTKSGENFLATDDLLGTRRLRPGLDGAWRRLADALGQHEGDALVSNELLAPINPRKRRLLVSELAPAEPHVVITARDLGRVIPSQWQTGARNRNTVGWTDYVEALQRDDPDDEVVSGFWRRQDLAEIVTRWSRHVPIDRITVVTVPRSGTAPEVFGRRFASAFGVDATTFEQPPYSNAAVGAYSAELLRRVNERTADLDWLKYRWAFKNALSRLVLAERADQEPAIVLSDDQLAWARDRAAQQVAALTGTGVRVVGDLDDLEPAASASSAPVDPADTSTDQLLDLAVDALVGMGEILADARIEHDLLVREVEAQLPVGDDAAREQRDFLAYEAALPGEPSSQMVKSRFQRWRLARRADEAAQGGSSA